MSEVESRRPSLGAAPLTIGLALLALGGAWGPAEAAAAFPGQGFLPEGRAWELVSPPEKNGGEALIDSPRTRAAADGSAVSFVSLGGFADVRGFGVGSEYIAQRSTSPDPGNNGWSTHAITPPQESSTYLSGTLGFEPRYMGGFSEDLSRGVFFTTVASPLTSDPNVAEASNLYLRRDLRSPGPGDYELATPCPICSEPIAGAQVQYPATLAGASADYEHLLFESKQALAAGGSLGQKNAYEWDHGTLRLAGVLPSGAAAPLSMPGSGVDAGNFIKATSRPISRDGSRLLFTTPANNETASGSGIYQRIAGRTTIKLNVSERAVPDAPQPARYWDASADGSRVFFSSEESLTEDAPVDPEAKLYMWKRAANSERQSLSVNATGGSFALIFNGRATEPIPFDASAEQVQIALEELSGPAPLFEALLASGKVAVSGSPGAYEIAFAGDLAGVDVPQLSADATGLAGPGAAATLTTVEAVENLTYMSPAGEPASVQSAVRGVIGASADGRYLYFLALGQLLAGAPQVEAGLYLWHEGALTFLGGMDAFAFDVPSMLDGGLLASRQKQSSLTPDGRHLLFNRSTGKDLLSIRGGLDYDHGTCEKDGFLRCQELYLYDADADTLRCATCNPTGAPATVSAESRARDKSGGTVTNSYLSRVLSEDGRYAFFTTAEQLLAGDVNGVKDAYLYDTATARPHLLSSGESPHPSYFLESSPDGRDAFFVTRERLSGWDFDNAYDLYDARVGGGFPEPRAPAPSCQGDACQPPPRELNDPTPNSSGYAGPGNETRAPKVRCGKGQRQVKARGKKSRCVKRKAGQGKKHVKRDAKGKRRAGR